MGEFVNLENGFSISATLPMNLTIHAFEHTNISIPLLALVPKL